MGEISPPSPFFVVLFLGFPREKSGFIDFWIQGNVSSFDLSPSRFSGRRPASSSEACKQQASNKQASKILFIEKS